jgi:hypothetical protein
MQTYLINNIDKLWCIKKFRRETPNAVSQGIPEVGNCREMSGK